MKKNGMFLTLLILIVLTCTLTFTQVSGANGIIMYGDLNNDGTIDFDDFYIDVSGNYYIYDFINELVGSSSLDSRFNPAADYNESSAIDLRDYQRWNYDRYNFDTNLYFTVTNYYTPSPINLVPEPATIILMGLGLLAISGLTIKKKT